MMINATESSVSVQRSQGRGYHVQHVLNHIFRPHMLQHGFHGLQATPPLGAPLLLWLLHNADPMEVHLSGSEGDEGWGDVVDAMERSQALGQSFKVLCRCGRDPPRHSAVHAQEGDDVHLVPQDVDIDLYLPGEVC